MTVTALPAALAACRDCAGNRWKYVARRSDVRDGAMESAASCRWIPADGSASCGSIRDALLPGLDGQVREQQW